MANHVRPDISALNTDKFVNADHACPDHPQQLDRSNVEVSDSNAGITRCI